MDALVIGSAPTLSVVICAFTERRWRDLVAAVDSLAPQSRAPDEVVVVIDHNADLHSRAAAELPSARVVANEHVPGLSGARNTGVEATSGDVVAFMDDDATADRDWLETLLGHYRDPEVIAVGGAVVPQWETARPRGFPEEFDWVVGCTYRGMPTGRRPVRNLIGANMSFRRETFGAVGRFSEGVGRVGLAGGECEETEFFLRVRATFPGGVVLYEPAARVNHRVPSDRTCWRYFSARCYREGFSKAQVTQRAGLSPGLSSERAYAARTIPVGVLRALGSALTGDRAGLVRAAVLVVGLWVTSLGFVVGCARYAVAGEIRRGPDAATRSGRDARPYGRRAQRGRWHACRTRNGSTAPRS